MRMEPLLFPQACPHRHGPTRRKTSSKCPERSGHLLCLGLAHARGLRRPRAQLHRHASPEEREHWRLATETAPSRYCGMASQCASRHRSQTWLVVQQSALDGPEKQTLHRLHPRLVLDAAGGVANDDWLGITTSITTTSGNTSAATRAAPSPSPAYPTTSNSLDCSRTRVSSTLAIGWVVNDHHP